MNGECRLPSLTDRLAIVFEDGEKGELLLFDDKPLIFKLRNNWTGEGHKTSGITKGYFVVIAPNEWERTGHVPVEPEGCADTGFTAHYFFRDGKEAAEDIGGFRECDVSSFSSGFELTGKRIFDDSEDGDLFAGDVPILNSSQEIVWARVGAEEENGWKGENFEPDKRTLAEILNGRQGRFFVRVYDDQIKLLDSGEFRYLRDLKQIRVNGKPYTEHTILLPSSTGHPPTKVRFIGVDGGALRPILPPELTHAEARGSDLVVESHPDADYISCTLESDTGRVAIVVNLPRVWWRMEIGGGESGDWRNTPLVMTRQEFRERARADATMRLRLPRRIKSIRVGFDDELELEYHRKREEDISIPLAGFDDYTQIDRRLNEDASFNVGCGGAVLTLIRVSADPVPEIVSFTCEPDMVATGEQAVLRWATRNAEADGVVIDLFGRRVEPNGSLRIRPAETTPFTLRLRAPGMEDVTQDVTVTVETPPQPGEMMTPVKLLVTVRRMQQGEFLEYYRGFLGKDFSAKANRLRNATQLLEQSKIIHLVQAKPIYYIVRSENELTQSVIDEIKNVAK